MIATSAFGMGVDVDDIRRIIHLGFPYTMMDYVQQCGRGGRDGEGCECLLYASLHDVANNSTALRLRTFEMFPLAESVKIKKKTVTNTLKQWSTVLKTRRKRTKKYLSFSEMK